jgi:aspartate/methionine/tyrosine aminotransferase
VSAGFSKWAGAGGWRLGYQLYPTALSDLYEAVRAAASYTYTSAPTPQQYAAVEVTLLHYTNNTDFCLCCLCTTTVSVLLHKCSI